jgi:hypothetical protein
MSELIKPIIEFNESAINAVDLICLPIKILMTEHSVNTMICINEYTKTMISGRAVLARIILCIARDSIARNEPMNNAPITQQTNRSRRCISLTDVALKCHETKPVHTESINVSTEYENPTNDFDRIQLMKAVKPRPMSSRNETTQHQKATRRKR